jgi:hypothetical protein
MHATPVNWRRIRSDFIYRIAFGSSVLALNAHGLTMWLLRVPIEIFALYALRSSRPTRTTTLA